MDCLPVDDKWSEVPTIYDVGMNSGQDTEYYLLKGFRVVAVEANPLLCKSVREKFDRYINTGQLIVLNLGVSEQLGRADFFVTKERTEWSSFYHNIAGREGFETEVISVKCDTMANILSKYGLPYYLKIDIEGKDKAALSSVFDAGYDIPYISVENGADMLPLFRKRGYDSFKYIQQNSVHLQTHEQPAKEGVYVPFEFEFGASGKFGEETDGEWVDYDNIYPLVNRVWSVETGDKRPGWDDGRDGWFDLHARHRDYLRK